jgi:hypothetical protein
MHHHLALFCYAISNVNWIWFAVAFIIVLAAGIAWYSVLFPKIWARVFNVNTTKKPTTKMLLRTMVMQLVVNLLFGLALFVITNLSVWVALLALVGFSGWEKGELNFQFPRWKDYWRAAVIRAGYTFIAGVIFMLFAMI